MDWLDKVRSWILDTKKDSTMVWAKESGWLKYHCDMAILVSELEKRISDLESKLPPNK